MVRGGEDSLLLSILLLHLQLRRLIGCLELQLQQGSVDI